MPRYATLMRFDLTIDTPWAIGAFTRSGTTGEDAVQAPIQRRPDGSVYLPATSLVGGLRDHLGEAPPVIWGPRRAGRRRRRSFGSWARTSSRRKRPKRSRESPSTATGALPKGATCSPAR